MKKFLTVTIFLGLAPWYLCGQGDFNKGVSFYKQGQYAKAVTEFEQIVKASPEYEAGFRVLGHCYLKLKDYRKAANSFDKAIDLKGENFVSYLGGGIAHYNLNEHRRAVALLLRAEKYAKTPKDRYQLYETRGAAYFKLGDFPKAIADLEKANSLQRGEVKNLQQLGIAYYQTDNLKKARTYLEQALALNPDSVQTKTFLSKIDNQDALKALEADNYAVAADLFRQYLNSNPDDGEAWFNLGLCQLLDKRLEEAQKSFSRSVTLLPDNWQAHDRLGYIYEIQEQYPKSLASYQKALNLKKDSRISESVERIQERIRRQNL